MGCSHYILDANKPASIKVVCYECGKEVDLNNPLEKHESCVGYHSDNENRLRVNIEFDNIHER